MSEDKKFDLQNHPVMGFKVSFMETHSFKAWRQVLSDSPNYFAETWALRDMHIKRCGFPIITTELFDELGAMLKGQRVADIGCGTGYLVYHLKKRDVDIVGIDSHIEDNHYFPNLVAQYLTTVKNTIVKMDYRDLNVDDYDVFIISWPDYLSLEAAEFIRGLPVGKTVIYQGEDCGGCCADDTFFEILEEDFNELDSQTSTLRWYACQFYGIHDNWTVYQKHRRTFESDN